MTWNDITYFFKRKYRQIERVIDFVPIIWKGYDFDYRYSLELFQKSLERQANFLESDKAYTMEAKHNASRIRTAIRLIDKVYDEEYGMEWINKIQEKYGKEVLEWDFEDTGDGSGSVYVNYKYDKWNNAEEIKKVKKELITQSDEQQRKAEKLLWKFIEHNIKHWWD